MGLAFASDWPVEALQQPPPPLSPPPACLLPLPPTTQLQPNAPPQAPRVAVIGAGIAGNAAALALAKKDVHCTVLDMGRAAGGRLATRHAEQAGLPLSFDHGAQQITAVGADFQRQVAEWQAAGVLAEWQGRHGTVLEGAFCE